MKGQVEPLTAVLITGLIMASVGTVYVWGTPLLEKREAESGLVALENDLDELRTSVNEVQTSGQDSSEQTTLNMPEDAEITINENDNTINIELEEDDPIYAEDSEFTLIGDVASEEGTYNTEQISYGVQGINSPSALTVETTSAAESSLISYTIEFNNLYTSTQTGAALLMTDIQTPGAQTSIGETEVLVTNRGEQIEEEAAELEDEIVDVHRNEIEITLD